MQTDTDQAFRKSTFCGNGACDEVARDGGNYLVRDSKDPGGPTLTFDSAEWLAFLKGAAAGEFGPA